MVTNGLGKMLWPALLGLLLAVGVAAAAAEPRAVTAREAIQLATESNSDLQLSKLNLKVAELRLEAARSAVYLPSLNLSVDPPQLTEDGLGSKVDASLGASLALPWGQGSLSAGIGLGYDIAASSLSVPTWQVGLSASTKTTASAGSLASLESAEETVASARRSLARAERQLVVSVLQGYEGVLSEAAQRDQDRESVARLQAEQTQVEELAARGYKSDRDVNQARLLLLDAQVKAERSEAKYASSLEAFCREELGLTEDCSLRPLKLSIADLLTAGHELLLADAPPSSVEAVESVISAHRAVEDAERSLSEARGSLLPSVTFSGKLDASEWRIGVGLSFEIFSPSHSLDVAIAKANLAVAEAKLASAKRSAMNQILDLKSSLLSAVRSGESLDLESEKWALQEKLLTVQHDAGSVSDSDWAEFLAGKASFEVETVSRASSLLVAYLSYRSALEVELDWEGWVQ